MSVRKKEFQINFGGLKLCERRPFYRSGVRNGYRNVMNSRICIFHSCQDIVSNSFNRKNIICYHICISLTFAI
jgi:hypothetical protein